MHAASSPRRWTKGFRMLVFTGLLFLESTIKQQQQKKPIKILLIFEVFIHHLSIMVFIKQINGLPCDTKCKVDFIWTICLTTEHDETSCWPYTGILPPFIKYHKNPFYHDQSKTCGSPFQRSYFPWFLAQSMLEQGLHIS